MNHVAISGRLTRDPELKYTTSGKAMTRFSLANNITKEKTVFVKFTAWDKQAESVQNYLTKGKSIIAEGYLDVRKYEDNEGNAKEITEVILQRWEFQHGNNKENGNGNGDGGSKPAAAVKPKPQAPVAKKPQPKPAVVEEDEVDLTSEDDAETTDSGASEDGGGMTDDEIDALLDE